MTNDVDVAGELGDPGQLFFGRDDDLDAVFGHQIHVFLILAAGHVEAGHAVGHDRVADDLPVGFGEFLEGLGVGEDEGVLEVGVVLHPALGDVAVGCPGVVRLAADLGVELEFVPTDWKTLVNGVVAGKYHLTGSASISPARMKVAGYSDSYLTVVILPFTTQDKADRFSDWADIDKPEVTVATTLGTTFEKYVKEWFPNAQIKVVEAPARGYQEVLAGRADVFVTSNIEGATLSTVETALDT